MFGGTPGGSRDPFSGGRPRGAHHARDPFGNSPFDDPFFARDPFGGRHMFARSHGAQDPFFSGGFGMGMHGMLGGGMGSSVSFSSSSSSFGGAGGGTSRSVSRSTKIVDGQAQTVTITRVQDANGTTVTEDYGNGRMRTTVNGVEQQNTLQSGHRPGTAHYISEGPNDHSTRQQHRSQPYPNNLRRHRSK
ncbi:hypothetical protein BJV82DRAFT_400150 [Fennellomyces sp. T-0311]|nr:hypothetical protein BJV82DRAFT_400150 [Fennellomyces sp. T-0311]